MLKEAIQFIADLARPLVAEKIITPSGGALVPFRNTNGATDFKQISGPHTVINQHQFADIQGFAAWVARECPDVEQCDILIAPTNTGLCVSSRLTNADEYADAPSAIVGYHPLFSGWNNLLNRQQSQKSLYSAIRPLIETIASAGGCPEGAHPGRELPSALRALTVAKSSKFEAELNRHGAYKMKGVSGTTETNITLPETFEIAVPIYRGVDDSELYRLELVIELNLDGTEPTFTITCPTLDLILDAAQTDAAAFLRSILGDGYLVARGQLKREIIIPVP